MLKLNKYLKEIGIDENFWLFKDGYKPDEEGFVAAEFYNLDHTLAMIIYSYLRYFKDNCLVGHPSDMTFEKWKEIIDKMIYSFETMIKDDNYATPLSKNKIKKVNYGLKLFVKYIGHLWY